MKFHLPVEAVAFSGSKRTTVAVYKHAQWTANVLQGSIVRPHPARLLGIALAVGAAAAVPLQATSSASLNYIARSHAAYLHPLIVGKVEAMAWTAAPPLAFRWMEAVP